MQTRASRSSPAFSSRSSRSPKCSARTCGATCRTATGVDRSYWSALLATLSPFRCSDAVRTSPGCVQYYSSVCCSAYDIVLVLYIVRDVYIQLSSFSCASHAMVVSASHLCGGGNLSGPLRPSTDNTDRDCCHSYHHSANRMQPSLLLSARDTTSSLYFSVDGIWQVKKNHYLEIQLKIKWRMAKLNILTCHVFCSLLGARHEYSIVVVCVCFILSDRVSSHRWGYMSDHYGHRPIVLIAIDDDLIAIPLFRTCAGILFISFH